MWLCFDLVDDGYITPDQAMMVLRRQMSFRQPIGQLAVECAVMTMGQVFDVLTQQVNSELPFGELAIEMGYLDRAQLGDLLLRQIDNVPPLNEILVQTGVITAELLDAALKRRRRKRVGTTEERQFELLTSL